MLETDLCKEMAIKDGYRGKSAVEDCNEMAAKDCCHGISAVEDCNERAVKNGDSCMHAVEDCNEMAVKDGDRSISAVEDCNEMAVKDCDSGVSAVEDCNEIAVKDGDRSFSAVEDCNEMAVKDGDCCMSAIQGCNEMAVKDGYRSFSAVEEGSRGLSPVERAIDGHGAGETLSQKVIHELQERLKRIAAVRAELTYIQISYQHLVSDIYNDLKQLVSEKCDLLQGTDGLAGWIKHKVINGTSLFIEHNLRSQQLALSQEYQRVSYYYQSQGLPPVQVQNQSEIIAIQHNFNSITQQLDQVYGNRAAEEVEWTKMIQPQKQQLLSQDPECLAIKVALEAWPGCSEIPTTEMFSAGTKLEGAQEIPKIIGKAKREGAQEQSGEGSALLSKTNNHNTEASAGKTFDQAKHKRNQRQHKFPNLKGAGPKGPARPAPRRKRRRGPVRSFFSFSSPLTRFSSLSTRLTPGVSKLPVNLASNWHL